MSKDSKKPIWYVENSEFFHLNHSTGNWIWKFQTATVKNPKNLEILQIDTSLNSFTESKLYQWWE